MKHRARPGRSPGTPAAPCGAAADRVGTLLRAQGLPPWPRPWRRWPFASWPDEGRAFWVAWWFSKVSPREDGVWKSLTSRASAAARTAVDELCTLFHHL